MSDAQPGDTPLEEPLLEEHIARVRLGHGANCSSVGSVVDTLFATAAVGAAVFAAIVAALESEEVRVVGTPKPKQDEKDEKAAAS